MTETRSLPGRAAAVLVASVLVGGATSWLQGVLPDALASLANSPSGWTVLTAALVAAARPTPGVGAVLGAASFVAMVLGYTGASQLRGLTYDPTLWGAIGLVAGPFVGAAAAAVAGRRAVPGAVGAGVLAGVLVADGIYGLTVVAASTSPVYWTGCLVVAGLVVAASLLIRRTPAAVAAVLLSTAASGGFLTLGYALLNAGLNAPAG